MFDVWIGDINLAAFVLTFSIVVLLPIQLLLCFKVKSVAIRLLPVTVLSIVTFICMAMGMNSNDWDGLGYLFLAIFAGFMVLMCGIGWGIWWFVNRGKQSKASR